MWNFCREANEGVNSNLNKQNSKFPLKPASTSTTLRTLYAKISKWYFFLQIFLKRFVNVWNFLIQFQFFVQQMIFVKNCLSIQLTLQNKLFLQLLTFSWRISSVTFMGQFLIQKKNSISKTNKNADSNSQMKCKQQTAEKYHDYKLNRS